MTKEEQAAIAHFKNVDPTITHVEDPHAVTAFEDGGRIFDVSPNGEKLSRFFIKHPNLPARRRSQDYSNAKGLIGDRPVYFASKDPRKP